MADSSKDDEIRMALVLGIGALLGICSAANWFYHELGPQKLWGLAILVFLVSSITFIFATFCIETFCYLPSNKTAREWMQFKPLLRSRIIPIPSLLLAFLTSIGFLIWLHWGDRSEPTVSAIMAALAAVALLGIAVSIPVILARRKVRQLVPRLTCPYCNNHIFVNEPWICGYGGHFNSGKIGHFILEACEQCGNLAKAYKCPHSGCGKPIPLNHLGPATEAEVDISQHLARKWVSEEEQEKQESEKQARQKRVREEQVANSQWEVDLKAKELENKEKARSLEEREARMNQEKKNLMEEFTVRMREHFKESVNVLLTAAMLKKEFLKQVDDLESLTESEKGELKRQLAARIEQMQTDVGSRSSKGFHKKYD